MMNDECGRMNVKSRAVFHSSFTLPHSSFTFILSILRIGPPSHSTQFQSRETQQREENRDDEEAEDDLRLLPAGHLEVVVQRRHLKEPTPRAQPPLRQLEERDLERHRQSLYDIDAADENQNQLLLRQHADGADGPADGEAAYVAHEDLCGRRVVPKETQTRADHRTAEDSQLA